jgi:phosphoglycolate phosphatase
VSRLAAALHLSPRTQAEIRSFVGEGARRLVERAVAPRSDLLEPALALWRDHYDAHCLDRTRLYPGVAAALAGAGRLLAVHTNKPGGLARKILAGLGVAPRFVAIVGGDDAPRKPDPAGTLEILARTSVSPADTLFVGDSRIDVETARAAGVALVAVTWGLSSRAELARAGATVFVDDAADLARWLA